MERVHAHLASLTLNDPGKWVGNKEFVFPTWRHPNPKVFTGKRVELCSAPASNMTHDVSGDVKWQPLNTVEPYVVSPNSSHAIKDSMIPFRARRAHLELGNRWNNSSGPQPVQKSASSRSLRSAKSCHVSLRGMTHKGLHTAASLGALTI